MTKRTMPFTTPIRKIPKPEKRKVKRGEYDRSLNQIARRIAKAGLPRKFIALFLGIRQKTLTDWMDTHPSLARAIEIGEMQHYSKLTKIIEGASSGDWKAAKYLLEIRHADVIQEPKKVLEQAEGKHSIRITLTERSDSRSITASTGGEEAIAGESIPIQVIGHTEIDSEEEMEN